VIVIVGWNGDARVLCEPVCRLVSGHAFLSDTDTYTQVQQHQLYTYWEQDGQPPAKNESVLSVFLRSFLC